MFDGRGTNMTDEHSKFHWSEGMKYVGEALKGSFLLNGAAAVSTFTILGNLKSSDDRFVYAMAYFTAGAFLSPISFAFAYFTQLQYGNCNNALAIKFHRVTYVSFAFGLIMFPIGVFKAAQAFLVL